MAILPILSIPDTRLRTKALPVATVDTEIQSLMHDMLETMHYQDRGIGLAANQVGVLKRIIVVDIGREYHPHPLKMANPEVFWHSTDFHTIQEGCLSVPEQWAEISRFNHIKVRYLDENNTPQELEAQGLLSCCIQHEIDHLDGVLFVDHLSEMKRRVLISRALKAKKNLQRHDDVTTT
jgi:peptide deformylase